MDILERFPGCSVGERLRERLLGGSLGSHLVQGSGRKRMLACTWMVEVGRQI